MIITFIHGTHVSIASRTDSGLPVGVEHPCLPCRVLLGPILPLEAHDLAYKEGYDAVIIYFRCQGLLDLHDRAIFCTACAVKNYLVCRLRP